MPQHFGHMKHKVENVTKNIAEHKVAHNDLEESLVKWAHACLHFEFDTITSP